MAQAVIGIKSVTVQPGETVSAIAKRELGNAGRWREVFLMNAQTMASQRANQPSAKIGPDFVWPGTELIIVDGFVLPEEDAKPEAKAKASKPASKKGK